MEFPPIDPFESDPSAEHPVVKDPVCGMTVDPKRSPHHLRWEGKTFHFCGKKCLETFERTPERYLAEGKTTASPQSGAKPVESLEDFGEMTTSRDPVCGRAVTAGATQFRLNLEGQSFYFCSAHCRDEFEAARSRFLQEFEEEEEEDEEAIETTRDPVCGMPVVVEGARYRHEHGGDTFYFCCQGCLEKFRAHPERFLEEGKEAPAPVPAARYVCPMCPEVSETKPVPCPKCGMALEPDQAAPLGKTEYVCPMDPEVVSSEPGVCPKCGMALEARFVATEEMENPELTDMKRRFVVSLLFTIPVVALAMIPQVSEGVAAFFEGLQEGGSEFSRFVPAYPLEWIEWILATPVVVWGGFPFFVRAVRSFRGMNLNMFTLIGIGTATAYLFSAAGVLFPGHFPPSFLQDGKVPVYFESAAVIITLVLLGQVLELRARARTSGAIRALLGLAPKTALLIREDGTEEVVNLDRVTVGDLLRVRPGQKVPVDGVVVEG
ncbi:MAG: YHS domain-containing protein, partial [Deltaproteobacteria bacterium]